MNVDFLDKILRGVDRLAIEDVCQMLVEFVPRFSDAYQLVSSTQRTPMMTPTREREQRMPDLNEFLSSSPVLCLPSEYLNSDFGHNRASSEYLLNIALVTYVESKARVFTVDLLKKYARQYSVLDAKVRAGKYLHNLTVAAVFRAVVLHVYGLREREYSLNQTRLLHVVEGGIVQNISKTPQLDLNAATVMVSAITKYDIKNDSWSVIHMLIRERLNVGYNFSLAPLQVI